MTTPNINRILRAHPVKSTHGAPMGVSNTPPGDTPLYVQRIKFVDGDYAPDGTYWGGSSPLWCGFDATATTRIYVRAFNRRLAIEAIAAEYPTAKFIGRKYEI